MKSHIVEKKYDFILSIGMIVKNEEKYLDECLKALQPLLNSVKSELVIVDTGSDDSTVEIAKRYTDKVYNFEWVDDFSAARNFNLKKCSGEWFMFIDADEIFDSDLSEMIDFFNNKDLNRKYNSATFVMRDCTDFEKTNWLTVTKSRIVRMLDGIYFINSVHECFNVFPSPSYEFKTFNYHYGYVYENEEQKEDKTRRNYTLLKKELEKNPDDLRVYSSFLNELTGDEYTEFLKEAFVKAKKKKDIFAAIIFLKAIRNYYDSGDNEKALECINIYLAEFKRKDALLLDIYVIKASALSNLRRYDDALSALDMYFKYYKFFESGKLDASPLSKVALAFANKNSFSLVKENYNNIKTLITEKTIMHKISLK